MAQNHLEYRWWFDHRYTSFGTEPSYLESYPGLLREQGVIHWWYGFGGGACGCLAMCHPRLIVFPFIFGVGNITASFPWRWENSSRSISLSRRTRSNRTLMGGLSGDCFVLPFAGKRIVWGEVKPLGRLASILESFPVTPLGKTIYRLTRGK